ncbi:MAG: RNA-binding protein [Crenarchaeota archaeon]|jgi:exosome complex component RRP4|nr:RNA-binding protein [Thermoproteota archaeon]
MTLYVTNRQIVLPGDPIATREYNVTGAVYWEGNCAYASTVALVDIKNERDINVIPLSGTYKPRVGDIVIGYITDILVTGWEVDIKSPYKAYLPLQEATLKYVDITTTDLRTLLDINDVILARIIDFNLAYEIPVTLTIKEAKLGKITTGTIVEIQPVKVPRVIGKKGSMVALFKEELNCDVIVGQNGRIWIKCQDEKDEAFLAQVIKFIERESHLPGLTEKVKAMIKRYKLSKT